jgi:hypothetical protein
MSSVALAFMVMVLPNSNRLISLPLFFASAICSVAIIKFAEIDRFIWSVLAASGAVTSLYLAVGVYKEAYDAVAWVLFVYVVSPAFWILILSAVFQLRSDLEVVHWMMRLGYLGALSVFVYFAVFFTLGPTYLTVFIAEPNAAIVDGQPAAAMHVFGSLLFVCGGFFAAPQLIKRWFVRTLVAITLLAVVILSGRSALFVAVLSGLAVAVVAGGRVSDWGAPFRNLGGILVVALVALVGVELIYDLGSADLLRVPLVVFDKIWAGGGEERIDQGIALRAGIAQHFFLGAGHGIGASYIRDYDQPWRYELLWLATLFRVGLFGTAVYLLPAIVIVGRYVRSLFARETSSVGDFMLGGFIAMFLGAATNPYLESFEFQWMLVLPFLYFCRAN